MDAKYNIDFLETATETLRAVAHPVRIIIIELLFEHEQLSVKEIQTKIDIEQAVASHHLRIMKAKNIVKVSRDGKHSFYSLRDQTYYHIIQNLKKILS